MDEKLKRLLLALCRMHLGYRNTEDLQEDHATIRAFIDAQEPRCPECGQALDAKKDRT